MASNATSKKKGIPVAVIILAGLVLGIVVGVIIQHPVVTAAAGLLVGLLLVPVFSAKQK